MLKSGLRSIRQSLELPHHEFRHVAGVVPVANPIQVPDPAGRIPVEPEQPFFGQRRKKLYGKEWVAASLLLDQLREGTGSHPVAAEGIGDQSADIIGSEIRQRDFLYPRSIATDRGKCLHQRMSRTDIVVAIGSDEQHVPYFRIRNQTLQQFQGRRVQPLQIVEE